MRVLLVVLPMLFCPAAVSAQAVDLTQPDPFASALADARLSLNAERREAGAVLAVEGLLSLVAGSVIAAVTNTDAFWLAFGAGTAGWGAVNAALALGMLDLGDGRARAIERGRQLRYDALDRAHAASVQAQSGAATLFAFNTGLDVFYIATGVLLFLLADQISGVDEPELLRGYSVAQMSQGAFLLVFDLFEWIASGERRSRLQALTP